MVLTTSFSKYRTSCYPNNTPTSRISTNLADENCEDKIDEHWRPFTFQCSYCDINYDLIGRMETWNDDIKYQGSCNGVKGCVVPSRVTKWNLRFWEEGIA